MYDGNDAEPDYDDDDGAMGEAQGADSATLDPMAMIMSAMEYGKKQLGVRARDQGQQDDQMSFDDGGVVPTDDTPQQGGNPDAIDPRAAMQYLTGTGAVSPEIAQALEQHIDPQGQMGPAERTMAAVQAAPNDEARFGMLQHYRSQFNARSGAAKAAMSRGDLGEAAKQATSAMANVPNGKQTVFAPTQGGLVMVRRPLGGGKAAPAPQQQAFDEGGEVEEADAPQESVPAQEPMGDVDPSTMPEQTVMNPQQLAQLFDSGFDKQIEDARGGSQRPVTDRAKPAAPPMLRNEPMTPEQVAQSYGGVIGLGEEPTARAAMGQTPPQRTGSEAATRPAAYPTAGSEAAVRTPESDPDMFAPAQAPGQAPGQAPSGYRPTSQMQWRVGENYPPQQQQQGVVPTSGGAGKLPTIQYGMQPATDPMSQAMREANRMNWGVGQEQARAAWVRQRASDIASPDEEDRKSKNIMERQNALEIGRDRRQQNDFAARSERQERDLTARSQRQGASEQLKVLMANSREATSLISRMLQDPRYSGDSFKVLTALGPLAARVGISQDQIDRALAGAHLSAPSGVVPTQQQGGGGNDPVEQAARRSVKPGDRVPFQWSDGKTYYYKIDNLGRPQLEQ